MKLVFDVEANGLNEVILNPKGDVVPEGTVVHCLVTLDVDTNEVTTYVDNIEEGIEALRNADLLIGHNICMYDIPFLERLYGPINTRLLDTLIVSRMMYPDKTAHPLGGNSLKAWGKALGHDKIEYTGGWESFSDDMLEYCIQDVRINLEIYFDQEEFILLFEKSIKLEHMVTRIISRQIENGFGFDLDEAEKLEVQLLAEKAAIDDSMREIFKPKVEERYSDKTGKKLKDKVTIFNPNSRQQIAERLRNKYGWIAPMTDKGNPKVDSAVLKKLDFPEAKILTRGFDIVKLSGQVSDWIKRASASRDGRVHGYVNVQGTVTGRMTANQPNLQQVSGDPRARALFVPRKKWVQVGIDAKGLEARMLANRMSPYDDGEYGQLVVQGDVHLENQRMAGLNTKAQAKTFFYGLIYGAGDQKIGQIIGKSATAGKDIRNRFLNKMPALKKLIDNCKFQVAKKRTITLLDQREVPCRSNHAALNVQLQGDGAIVMKLALCLLVEYLSDHKDKWSLMATVHDEWQIECDPAIADHVGKMGCKAIVEAGERLGCKIPLEGNYSVGKNWAECH